MTTKSAKTEHSWACQECGKRLSAKQAERVMLGPNGCPKCGGADVDIYVPKER